MRRLPAVLPDPCLGEEGTQKEPYDQTFRLTNLASQFEIWATNGKLGADLGLFEVRIIWTALKSSKFDWFDILGWSFNVTRCALVFDGPLVFDAGPLHSGPGRRSGGLRRNISFESLPQVYRASFEEERLNHPQPKGDLFVWNWVCFAIPYSRLHGWLFHFCRVITAPRTQGDLPRGHCPPSCATASVGWILSWRVLLWLEKHEDDWHPINPEDPRGL